MLASELFNGYHKKTNIDRCTIKFDISKAFDTVRWSFITVVLRALGLSDMFINWIKICISTVSFLCFGKWEAWKASSPDWSLHSDGPCSTSSGVSGSRISYMARAQF